ncbi:hypothetical protein M406DRAFT_55886, partial [Cryphonectria parasitica EP155]
MTVSVCLLHALARLLPRGKEKALEPLTLAYSARVYLVFTPILLPPTQRRPHAVAVQGELFGGGFLHNQPNDQPPLRTLSSI